MNESRETAAASPTCRWRGHAARLSLRSTTRGTSWRRMNSVVIHKPVWGWGEGIQMKKQCAVYENVSQIHLFGFTPLDQVKIGDFHLECERAGIASLQKSLLLSFCMTVLSSWKEPVLPWQILSRPQQAASAVDELL